jgi:hypothetical protein
VAGAFFVDERFDVVPLRLSKLLDIVPRCRSKIEHMM